MNSPHPIGNSHTPKTCNYLACGAGKPNCPFVANAALSSPPPGDSEREAITEQLAVVILVNPDIEVSNQILPYLTDYVLQQRREAAEEAIARVTAEYSQNDSKDLGIKTDATMLHTQGTGMVTNYPDRTTSLSNPHK